ncbi:VOC family protein [Nitrospirillum iridis]|uniref:Catechol 2,3-dioxygenase-like lactoylglutathione lyase family enzyme n=1 Tax=Nitrospirillum iridis TaxID=765888 RepID=A0A7X0B2A3_9PROT|nr:VOC family protein [Nitrospirillum iridis]MBB6254377.1 catechol 2,3-dioxygenase-like lactoylglutathione lyase family enzyme [Nitrospirillum iridis]
MEPDQQAAALRWGRPPDALAASLHFLELGCPDPAATADFYRRTMGYRLEAHGDRIVAAARDRRLIFTPGPAKTLVSAGYALPDGAELARLRARLSAAGWGAVDGPTPMFTDAVTVTDPDGNRFTFGLAQPSPVAGQAGAGGAEAGNWPARLQHVVIASRDPARIVQFFIDVLGFTLSDDVVDGEGGIRTSFLRCSHEHHSFAVFKAPENRLDHHCYETTDWNMIRDWCDRMATQHVRVQWGPGRHGPGNNLFMFVHDPDGNWVEISAELEIVTPDRPVGQWPHEQRTLNSWGHGLLRS